MTNSLIKEKHTKLGFEIVTLCIDSDSVYNIQTAMTVDVNM